MKYEVRWGERHEALEFERDGSTLRWKLADESRTGDLLEVEPGIYSFLVDGHSYDVKSGVNPDGSCWVDLNGRRHPVDVTDPRRNGSRPGRAHAEGRARVQALMPGKVLRVLVAPGDAVTAGQGLLVVEAMKMQNEMKSPKDGTVVEVKTKEGATVAPGEVLLVVE